MLTGQNGILNRTAIEEENGIRAVIPNGFYIARYEAGLPADENLWAWKNNASWNRVSQTNAVKLSKKCMKEVQ